MQFHHFPAFSKHLLSLSREGLPRLYLIVAPCPFEAKKLSESLLHLLQKQLPSMGVETGSTDVEAMIESLSTYPMFGTCTAIVCEEAERLSKGGWDAITAYAENPSPFGILIFLATQVKGQIGSFCQKVKRHLAVLDVTEEKPWDRKIRLERYLVELARKEGYRLQPEGAAHLLDRLGSDLPALEQALTKLFCYVGERRVIAIEDIDLVCVAQDGAIWQLAEGVIWDPCMPHIPRSLSIEDLLGLIGALRLQLQQGLQMAACLAKQISPQELHLHLPSLRASSIKKRIDQVQRRGESYFRKGIEALFELEMRVKNHEGNPLLLLEYFCAKVNHA